MAITLEVAYFNSFWLKRLKKSNDLTGGVDYPGTTNGTPRDDTVTPGDGYIEPNVNEDWYIEEARIRGGYNNTSVDFGVKAYIIEDDPDQQHRTNSLIYSGIFNSRTGINNTNQFPTGEDITRTVDPISGSIQKLYSENTNLLILQEKKVNRALIDKDAIYTAEGQPVTASSNIVIGQIQPFEGNFGISRDPGSFAVYGYNKYFTDRDRSAVLRLGGSGIEEISNNGMIDWFRDSLLAMAQSNGIIKGAWDVFSKNYTLSLQGSGDTLPDTLAFDEISTGWVSFYDYIPEQMASCLGNFYSWKDAKLWKHYQSNVYNDWYDATHKPSTVTFVFNPNPVQIKTFQTINYKGSNGWEVTSILSDITGVDTNPQQPLLPDASYQDGGLGTAAIPVIYSYDEGYYVDGGVEYRAGFDRKQNTYYAAIKNNSQPRPQEVIFDGASEMGIKAFYATVKFSTDSVTDEDGAKQLFSVGATFANR